MAFNNKKPTEKTTPTTPEQQLKQPNAHTCATCQGRGIRPEISETELCPDCGGSGTIEG